VYGPQRILKDRIVPRSLVYSCRHFCRQMIGVEVPRGIYTHVAGIDLVRDSRTGHYLVLEDNVRTPSGISYVLKNGQVMTRTLPVDVRVRPALDAEGREQLRETAAGPAQLPPADEPPQQQQQ
jgi:uncharacterized circularly permuted ATP-grasp superfamily protein